MKRALSILAGVVFLGSVCFAESLDQHARATELTIPRYPVAKRGDAEKGVATVVVHVDEKGVATIDRVMGSYYTFAEAVTTAAKTWKFEPGTRNGKPADDLLEFIFTFDPQDGVKMLGPLFRP